MLMLFGLLGINSRPVCCKTKRSKEGPSSIWWRSGVLCMGIIEFVEKGLNISNHGIVTRVNCRVDSIQFIPHIDLKIPWCTGVCNNVGEGIQVEELIQHRHCFISKCWWEGNCGEAVLNSGVRSNADGADNGRISYVVVTGISLCGGEKTEEQQDGGEEERRVMCTDCWWAKIMIMEGEHRRNTNCFNNNCLKSVESQGERISSWSHIGNFPIQNSNHNSPQLHNSCPCISGLRLLVEGL